MADLRFEWDPEKDKQNQRKHSVAFEEGRPLPDLDQSVLARLRLEGEALGAPLETSGVG